jgi:hypothetical protein
VELSALFHDFGQLGASRVHVVPTEQRVLNRETGVTDIISNYTHTAQAFLSGWEGVGSDGDKASFVQRVHTSKVDEMCDGTPGGQVFGSNATKGWL